MQQQNRILASHRLRRRGPRGPKAWLGAWRRAGSALWLSPAAARIRRCNWPARIDGCRASVSPQEVVDCSDLVFLTVPDDAIAAVAAGLTWRKDVAAIHCSGATELAALASAARGGAQIGGFHPLQLFADPDVALAGLPAALSPSRPKRRCCCSWNSWRRRCAAVRYACRRGCRARYHAAAHYAAGFVITLLNEAVELWQSFGIEREDTIRALLPLLRGTAASVERSGLAQGLAGTYSRGDIGTLEKHLAELARVGPDALHLYCELALRSIPLGLERGGYDETAPRQCACCCGAHWRPSMPGRLELRWSKRYHDEAALDRSRSGCSRVSLPHPPWRGKHDSTDPCICDCLQLHSRRWRRRRPTAAAISTRSGPARVRSPQRRPRPQPIRSSNRKARQSAASASRRYTQAKCENYARNLPT